VTQLPKKRLFFHFSPLWFPLFYVVISFCFLFPPHCGKAEAVIVPRPEQLRDPGKGSVRVRGQARAQVRLMREEKRR